MKAFDCKDKSSDVNEETNLTGVGQPISEVATDRTSAWVVPVST